MKKSILRKRWEKGEFGLLHLGIYVTSKERTHAFNKEASTYCSQNDQNCTTCSLVNYGFDCHNHKIGGRSLPPLIPADDDYTD